MLVGKLAVGLVCVLKGETEEQEAHILTNLRKYGDDREGGGRSVGFRSLLRIVYV